MNSLSKKPYAMIEITVPIGRMFSKSVVSDEQDVKYALILNDEQIWTNAEEHIASMDCLNAENKGEGWTINRNRVNDGGLELLTLVPDEMLSLSTVSISRLTVAVCSLSVAVIVAVSYLLASSFSKRINVVCQAMQQLQKGRFDRRLKISSYDEIGYLMSVYNQTCGRMEELIERLHEEHNERTRADIIALQAQINPHFLYNSLTSVIRLIESDRKSEACEMVSALVHFYRVTFKADSMVTIQNEAELLREYLRICSIRFSDYTTYEVNADDSILQCRMLSMIVQPFVENIYRHALREDRIVHISVGFYAADDDVHIVIEDDGMGMDESARRAIRCMNECGSHAIGNIQRRIRLSYGDGYGVQLRKSDETGSEFRIILPQIRDEG